MTIVLWWRQPFSVVTPQLERAKSKKQKVMILFMGVHTIGTSRNLKVQLPHLARVISVLRGSALPASERRAYKYWISSKFIHANG